MDTNARARRTSRNPPSPLSSLANQRSWRGAINASESEPGIVESARLTSSRLMSSYTASAHSSGVKYPARPWLTLAGSLMVTVTCRLSSSGTLSRADLRFHLHQSSAMVIAPAAISSTPTPLPHVSFSPRNAVASKITNTTLSLSMGATRDASPTCSAWK